MDRRRTKNLDGKCGSCRFFTVDSEWECTGFCSGSKNHKGRIERTYKCIGYEPAPTMLSGDCNVCINGKMPSYSATCVECGLSRKNYKPMSNADRIRAMTDEEIENWYWWMHKEMMRYTDSRVFVHNWLKQEASE